jgi:hypothetical protein
MVFPDPSDWGTYFDDLAGMVPFPDQMFYIRPDYPGPESFEPVQRAVSDEGSTIEYIIEDVDSIMPDVSKVTKIMVDTAIEANKN